MKQMIALGGFGKNFLYFLRSSKNEEFEFIAIDSQESCDDAQEMAEFLGCKLEFKDGITLCVSEDLDMELFISDMQDEVSIACGLGGEMSEYLVKFIQQALSKGKKIKLITVLPFLFEEGRERRKRAMDALEVLKSMDIEITFIDNQDSFLEIDYASFKTNSFFDAINEKLFLKLKR